MLELIQKGGIIMWLIFFCSCLGLGVFFERFIFLHRSSIRIGELITGLSLLVRSGRISEALRECTACPSPVTRVLQAALLRHHLDRVTLSSIVKNTAILEIPKLSHHLQILAMLCYLVPLLGLLGTILGLWDSFLVLLAHGSYASMLDLSVGVCTSFLNIIAALAVAIPCYVGHTYLTTRINHIIQDMERAGIEIVNLLEQKKDTQTIS